jgi:hypothetical protein
METGATTATLRIVGAMWDKSEPGRRPEMSDETSGKSRTNTEPVEFRGYRFEPKQVIYCACGCVWGLLGVTEDHTAARMLVIESPDNDGTVGSIITVPLTRREEGQP